MPMITPRYPFVDLALSRRLERAEGGANAASVEARARLWPERGAAWIDVGGTFAMFDGADSPLTQTFGLGLFAEATPARLEEIERFFAEREARVFHEVSPLAPSALPAALTARGYAPLEFTSVMFRPVLAGPLPLSSNRIRVRVAGDADREAWGRTSATGWGESPEIEAFMRDIGTLTMATPDATCFLAEIDDEPVATGVLRILDGVALLAGASTVPARRGLGAQQALLGERLRFAAERGCDLAMMCAAPGSASQRNAERNAFRIAYTRIKWQQRGI
jgi:hypothetical protein